MNIHLTEIMCVYIHIPSYSDTFVISPNKYLKNLNIEKLNKVDLFSKGISFSQHKAVRSKVHNKWVTCKLERGKNSIN